MDVIRLSEPVVHAALMSAQLVKTGKSSTLTSKVERGPLMFIVEVVLRTKERKNERTKERKNERTQERKNLRTKETKIIITDKYFFLQFLFY